MAQSQNASATKHRILKVTIKQMLDDSPDTSWMGEYSDTPETEYAIDRATDSFQGDIDAGQDWLDRIESRLQDTLNELPEEDPLHLSAENSAIGQAISTVYDLRMDAPFNNVSWDRRTYRYFNAPVENYKGESPEDIRKYARQDYKRMEDLNNGHFGFIGISAEAQVQLTGDTVQRITSGGLWGIESDSEKSYLESVEQEELGQLKTELTALGFSKRAIAKAFQSIVRKES